MSKPATSTAFGAEYHDFSSVQFAAGMQAISKIQPSDKTLEILDIGCGSGRTTNELLKPFPNATITGIDISQELLTTAQQEFQQPGLNFTVGNAEDIPTTPKYDIIFSFFCLQFINEENLPDAITKIFNAVKPGGEVYIFIPRRHEQLIKTRNTVMEQFREELGNFNLPKRLDTDDYFQHFDDISKQFSFNKALQENSVFDPDLTQEEFEQFFTGISRERRLLSSDDSKSTYTRLVAEAMPKKPNGRIDFQFKFTSLHYTNIHTLTKTGSTK